MRARVRARVRARARVRVWVGVGVKATSRRLPHRLCFALQVRDGGRRAEAVLELVDEIRKVRAGVVEAGCRLFRLSERLTRPQDDVLRRVHGDRLRDVCQLREGTATPLSPIVDDKEDGHLVLHRLAELQTAPCRLEDQRREKKHQHRRLAHGELELRQLDEVVAVDEGAVAGIGQLIVHACDGVLRL